VLDLDYNITHAGIMAPGQAAVISPIPKRTSSVHNHTGGRRRSVSITAALSTPRDRNDPPGTRHATPPTTEPSIHDSNTFETSYSKPHPALETEHSDQTRPRGLFCFNGVQSCCDIDDDGGESEWLSANLVTNTASLFDSLRDTNY
jgi:hypothetical protein